MGRSENLVGDREQTQSINLSICPELIKSLDKHLEKNVLILIDGSPASGKSELAQAFLKTLPIAFPYSLPPTNHLESDFCVYSREYRNQLKFERPDEWEKLESWFRHDKLVAFIDQYLSSLITDVDSLKIEEAYQHGLNGLTEKSVPVTPWTILEGIFSIQKKTIDIINNFPIKPITIAIDDVSLEERVKRIRTRAPFWGQDPDEQQSRMEKIFEPSWQRRRLSVLGLSEYVTSTNGSNVAIVKRV